MCPAVGEGAVPGDPSVVSGTHTVRSFGISMLLCIRVGSTHAPRAAIACLRGCCFFRRIYYVARGIMWKAGIEGVRQSIIMMATAAKHSATTADPASGLKNYQCCAPKLRR